MVPVIRNVEGMNFADIEKAIGLLGEKVIFIFTTLIITIIIPPFKGETVCNVAFILGIVVRL